jgi:hypothetical protein
MTFIKNNSIGIVIPKNKCSCGCNTCDKKVQKANSSGDGSQVAGTSQTELPSCSPKS